MDADIDIECFYCGTIKSYAKWRVGSYRLLCDHCGSVLKEGTCKMYKKESKDVFGYSYTEVPETKKWSGD